MNCSQMEIKKEYIVNSHRRCSEYEVEKERIYSKKIISGDELSKKLELKKELIDIAGLYMNRLYDFVKGSNFFCLLTDEEGCILSIIGDTDILLEAFSFKMVPGAYMDERNIGTNSMGTALAEGKPVQVSGEEHYIKAYHRWTCSASPIRNSKGEIIGTIDLTGYSEFVNLHTLGMIVAAANAIEEMIDIKRYNEELSMAKKFTETIIDSIESGILTSDFEGNIKTVNRYVSDMFGYKQNEIKLMKAWDLIEDWENIKTSVIKKQSFTDEEVFVNSKGKKLQFNLSVYPHLDDKQNLRNIVFVFKEVKKVRKLANKIMGHQAFYTFDKIIGQNKNFVQILEYAKKIADSRSNVLIMGESGTGKELYAQAIHNYSSRKDEPFVALNCGAIPRELIESELFGYEGGAFTGAKSAGQPGKFEIADGGTIFLDEIGEMPLDMQTRLLRVIEEGTVNKVGSIKEIVVDVRVIAATNKDLNEEVGKGNFRKDLYYRLNVLPIRLMPLRERKDDIPLLSQYFMKRISKKLNKNMVNINEETMKSLIEYEWPGNVRELENIIELMVNTESIPDRFIKLDNNPFEEVEYNISMKNLGQELAYESIDENLKLVDIEKRHILKVLNYYSGNITLCAKALGIGRNTLYRKMDNFEIKSYNSNKEESFN
ncbi:sigma-54-dependent Fis family transcriptional regulator [Anaerovorax odorimutans]|uniref:sigma-54-dependent Fis family transcriptional regulator n=1 Tax=Anaerovorax odorimutans TaxID=109327 RepID=UPI00040493B4|nr:sigma 54-interacting transcriptional regulator [Anaerovorax odorimutans]